MTITEWIALLGALGGASGWLVVWRAHRHDRPRIDVSLDRIVWQPDAFRPDGESFRQVGVNVDVRAVVTNTGSRPVNVTNAQLSFDGLRAAFRFVAVGGRRADPLKAPIEPGSGDEIQFVFTGQTGADLDGRSGRLIVTPARGKSEVVPFEATDVLRRSAPWE